MQHQHAGRERHHGAHDVLDQQDGEPGLAVELASGSRPCGRSRSAAGPPSPRRAAGASARSRARARPRAACGRAASAPPRAAARLSNRSSRAQHLVRACARRRRRRGWRSSAPTMTLSSTRQRRKRPHDLERAADAAAADLVGRQPVDALALRTRCAPVVRRDHAGDHVEQRGLAGAVRADHREDRALRHREADVGDRAQAAKRFETPSTSSSAVMSCLRRFAPAEAQQPRERRPDAVRQRPSPPAAGRCRRTPAWRRARRSRARAAAPAAPPPGR